MVRENHPLPPPQLPVSGACVEGPIKNENMAGVNHPLLPQVPVSCACVEGPIKNGWWE